MSAPSNPKLSAQRVKDSTKRVAEAISKLEVVEQELKWACEAESWNDDVIGGVELSIQELGKVLATLVQWFDDTEEANED